MKYWILVLLGVLSYPLQSQDVAAFTKKSNYGVRGQLNAGFNFYNYSGDGNERYAPFGYRISGSIYGNVGAISIPLNFSFNHLNGSVSSPFNLYGASPYYKWIKLHLGHRNLSFSPYVYSGRSFFGAGVELTPGKFSVVAFKGKMKNLLAIRDTVVTGTIVLPSYERDISGVKIGVGSRNNKIEFMGVRVVDDNIDIDNSIDLTPTENLVFGSSLKLKLIKRLRLEINASASIFTNDQNAREIDLASELETSIESIHGINSTTRASFAGDASMTYSFKSYLLGLKYKRVDPFYTSLATNFIQNDIENYTANIGLPIFSSKLKLRATAGLQQDNLKDQKELTRYRTIGSSTVSYFPNQKFNLIARYANYQNENQSGLIAINDTLKILTITHNASLASRLKVIDDDNKSVDININAYRNLVIDETEFNNLSGEFEGYGLTSRVTYKHKSINLSIGPQFNFNKYTFSEGTEGRIGIGVFISKQFLEKKLTTSALAMINQNQIEDQSNGQLINASMNARFKINKSNSINLRLNFFDNSSIIYDSYSELRGSLNYGYRFR